MWPFTTICPSVDYSRGHHLIFHPFYLVHFEVNFSSQFPFVNCHVLEWTL